MNATIPEADLEDRRIYRIRCRNLVVGAWDARRRGFIGIREKFGSLYLFEEYHYDTGAPFGTAHAIRAYDEFVPEDVPLMEYLGSFCKTCEKPVEGFPGERDGKAIACAGYTHVDPADRTCEAEGTYCSYLRSNAALFDLLTPYDDEINAQLRAEQEAADAAAASRRWRPQTEAEWLREQAIELVHDWREVEGKRVRDLTMDMPEDERREANKAMHDEYVRRYMAACKATPLPEETW